MNFPQMMEAEGDLVRVEAKPAVRVTWTVYPAGIVLSWPDVRHKDVPVVIGTVGSAVHFDHPGWPGIIQAVEKKQLHSLTLLGKNAEVHTLRVNCGPEGKALSAVFEEDLVHGAHFLAFPEGHPFSLR
jgi:hypothetical protein